MIPLLLHQPPLFDILPLYVVQILATPFVFATARRHGWGIVLSVSFHGSLAAQFSATHFPTTALLPMRGGSFHLPAWQFLWFCGVALEETSQRQEIIAPRFRTTVAGLAGILVLAGLCARHGIIEVKSSLFLWMDKWTFGPLRLLNFAAWVVLLLEWNPRPPASLMEQAALWGRHSLAVFAMHLPLVICAVSVIQMFSMTVLEKTFLGLSVIAAISIWVAWLEFNSRQRKEMAVSTLEPQPWIQRLNQEIIRYAPTQPAAG